MASVHQKHPVPKVAVSVNTGIDGDKLLILLWFATSNVENPKIRYNGGKIIGQTGHGILLSNLISLPLHYAKHNVGYRPGYGGSGSPAHRYSPACQAVTSGDA